MFENEHGPIFVHAPDRYGTLLMELSAPSPVHSLVFWGLKQWIEFFCFSTFLLFPLFLSFGILDVNHRGEQRFVSIQRLFWVAYFSWFV